MSNQEGGVSTLRIYSFIFGTVMLLYVQRADSSRLTTKVEAQTAATGSVPFGARILTGQNKIIHDLKIIHSVPSNLDTNEKSLFILNKGIKLTDGDMIRNSSGGSEIRKNNRVLKKIKSKRRRIHPTSRHRAWPDLSDNKNLSEKNHSMLHFKHASQISADSKTTGLLQEGRRNRTLHENNSFVATGNRLNGSKHFLPERQQNSVPKAHRNRIGSIERSTVRASVDTTNRNKHVIKELNRNKVELVRISRVNNRSDAVLNKDLPQVNQNPRGRNRETAPSDTTSWGRGGLPERLRNVTGSHERHRVTVPSDTLSWNQDLHTIRLNTESNDRNRSTVPSNTMSWNQDLYAKRLRNNTESNDIKRSTVPSYTMSLNHDLHTKRLNKESNDRNRSTVPSNTMSWNQDLYAKRLRNNTESNDIKRSTVPSYTMSLNHDLHTKRLNKESNDRNRSTVPSYTMSWNQDLHAKRLRNNTESNNRKISTVPRYTMSWNQDLLPERMDNRTRSHEINIGTVPSNNMPWNKSLQSEKQRNRVGLNVIRKVTVANQAMTKNNGYLKESNLAGPVEKSLVTVPDYTVTSKKDFLQQRHPNQTELRHRNNTAVSENTANRKEKLFKVSKDYSPFNFPHSLEKNDENPSKRRLPCPCHWSKEKCGCECTGSLNYDDFQTLAGYFQPCHNFTFSLKDGNYFSLPPNLFSRASPSMTIHLKISNATFDHLFDPTPATSPFRGVVLEQKALLELLDVSIRQGWNWGSLQDLRSSSGVGVDVVLDGCGLRRLSSDFAMVAGGDVGGLRVSDSGLEMVGSGAFATFAGLVRFQLPRNRLRSLRRTDLPPEALELVEIDLSANQLQTLDSDLFSEMPSLRKLVLAGNPLRTLGQETLATVIGRTHVKGLGEFPLQCDCRLRWLKNSTLDHSPVFLENLRGATCRRPPHLRGTPFKDLAEEHLTC